MWHPLEKQHVSYLLFTSVWTEQNASLLTWAFGKEL